MNKSSILELRATHVPPVANLMHHINFLHSSHTGLTPIDRTDMNLSLRTLNKLNQPIRVIWQPFICSVKPESTYGLSMLHFMNTF